MRLSYSYSGFGPLDAGLRAAEAAEHAGLDGALVAEHVGFHDGVVPCALLLGRTGRIEIGLVGPAPVSRHPGMLAMELSSLAEAGPGRVRAQIGLGDGFLIGRIGGRHTKGLGQVAEFVTVLRALLAGEQVDGTYCGHRFDGFQIAPADPAPPVDIMAIRPRMLAQAARIADGVSLSAGASLAYLAQTVRDVERKLAELGRDRADFRITAMALGAISPDLNEAAGYVSSALRLFSPEALGVLAPDVFTAEVLAEPGAPQRLLTADTATRLAVVATPESLPTVLAEYAATGIDELSVNVLNPPGEVPALMGVFAAARPRPNRRRGATT